MKSTKQIADILGVSKMTVYRFIKSNNITETSQDGRTLLYDDTSVNLILKGFSDKTDVTDVTSNVAPDFKEDYVIELEKMNVFLKKEIEDKNKQIDKLYTLLDQQQQLTLQRDKQIDKLQCQLVTKENGMSDSEKVEKGSIKNQPKKIGNGKSKETASKLSNKSEKGFWQRLFNS